MKPPKCKIFEPSIRYKQKVIRALYYDEMSLVIDIQGEKFSFARVVFHKPVGFRVLDERDLTEFWNTYNEQNGWLYEVLDGGWLELETKRESFASQAMFDLAKEKLHEYIIVDNKCISVLSINPPEIQDFGTDPTRAT